MILGPSLYFVETPPLLRKLHYTCSLANSESGSVSELGILSNIGVFIFQIIQKLVLLGVSTAQVRKEVKCELCHFQKFIFVLRESFMKKKKNVVHVR